MLMIIMILYKIGDVDGNIMINNNWCDNKDVTNGKESKNKNSMKNK